MRIDSATTRNLPTRQHSVYPLCSETLRLGSRHPAQVINIQTLNVELINEDALRFKGISSRSEFTRTLQILEGFKRHSPFVVGFYPRLFQGSVYRRIARCEIHFPKAFVRRLYNFEEPMMLELTTMCGYTY